MPLPRGNVEATDSADADCQPSALLRCSDCRPRTAIENGKSALVVEHRPTTLALPHPDALTVSPTSVSDTHRTARRATKVQWAPMHMRGHDDVTDSTAVELPASTCSRSDGSTTHTPSSAVGWPADERASTLHSSIDLACAAADRVRDEVPETAALTAALRDFLMEIAKDCDIT